MTKVDIVIIELVKGFSQHLRCSLTIWIFSLKIFNYCNQLGVWLLQYCKLAHV